MTVDEQHIAIEIGVNRIASFALDDFLSSEVDYFINEAIDDFIKLNIEEIRGARGNQSSLDNLRTIIKNELLSASSSSINSISNLYEVDLTNLSSNLYYYIESRSEIGSEWFDNVIYATSAFFDIIKDPFGTSDKRLPCTLIGDKLIVASNGGTIDNIDITYLSEPAKVDKSGSVDCDLPLNTHRDINEIAVQLILSNLGTSNG